jgi:hypothetical protein
MKKKLIVLVLVVAVVASIASVAAEIDLTDGATEIGVVSSGKSYVVSKSLDFEETTVAAADTAILFVKPADCILTDTWVTGDIATAVAVKKMPASTNVWSSIGSVTSSVSSAVAVAGTVLDTENVKIGATFSAAPTSGVVTVHSLIYRLKE